MPLTRAYQRARGPARRREPRSGPGARSRWVGFDHLRVACNRGTSVRSRSGGLLLGARLLVRSYRRPPDQAQERAKKNSYRAEDTKGHRKRCSNCGTSRLVHLVRSSVRIRAVSARRVVDQSSQAEGRYIQGVERSVRSSHVQIVGNICRFNQLAARRDSWPYGPRYAPVRHRTGGAVGAGCSEVWELRAAAAVWSEVQVGRFCRLKTRQELGGAVGAGCSQVRDPRAATTLRPDVHVGRLRRPKTLAEGPRAPTSCVVEYAVLQTDHRSTSLGRLVRLAPLFAGDALGGTRAIDA